MHRDDVGRAIEIPSGDEPLDRRRLLPGRARSRLAGARDVLPLVVGVLPLAMVIGVTARSTGIDLTAAWAASFLLIAGSAQLSMIQLLQEGAAPVSIVATATVINARFVVYSLGFRSWFEHEPMAAVCCWRSRSSTSSSWSASSGSTTSTTRPGDAATTSAAAGVLVGCWAGAQALSMAFAGSIPPSTLFEAATPIVFLGFLVPAVVDRPPRRRPSLAAGLATVAGSQLPFHSGLVVGIVGGVTAGVLARGRR